MLFIIPFFIYIFNCINLVQFNCYKFMIRRWAKKINALHKKKTVRKKETNKKQIHLPEIFIVNEWEKNWVNYTFKQFDYEFYFS